MPRTPLILPRPQEAAFEDRSICLVKGSVALFHLVPEGLCGETAVSALSLLETKLRTLGACDAMEGSYIIRLVVDPSDPAFAAHAVSDAYALRIGEGEAALVGRDDGGLYYAVVTFLQALQIENDRVSIPLGRVVDWPSFPIRSLFIEDRYGSDFLTKEDWFSAINYFAGMKYNQLTVGLYGCWCQQYDGMISEYLYVPFHSHPELQTPRNVRYYSPSKHGWVRHDNVLPVMFRDNYFGELVAYARARNIRVQPLVNSYGHNTLFPRLMPEISAKDEQGRDTGFGLCISDERTYQRMFELYDEIIDRYLLPNGMDSFHLGLDEVWEGIGMDAEDPFRFHTPFCKCEKCGARPRSELMIEYVIRIAKHLKEKGMRHVYFYYDMFFNIFKVLDESMWRKFREAGVDDVITIDWWDYSSEDGLFPNQPLDRHFHGIAKPITGYYHWSTPVEYLDNIRGVTHIAQKYGLDGLEGYSSYEKIHDRSYCVLADLAWNAADADRLDAVLDDYASMRFPGGGEAVRRALGDMIGVQSDNFMYGSTPRNRFMKLDYYTYTYVKAGEPYPRRFPEEAFEEIHRDLAGYKALFADVQAKAGGARACLDRFWPEGDGEVQAAWVAICQHFETVAGEYLGLLALEEETDAAKAADALRTLVDRREALMLRVEQSRIEANRLLYLRNMSVYRQVLLDLLDYALRCARDGKPFQLDMTHLDGIKSEMLKFLR
ncbi:MAG: family 20 glycosylhydrolase [Clostridia bacterium]|nr:family 20 glycosylhydrolase [Clostridia bacterium]